MMSKSAVGVVFSVLALVGTQARASDLDAQEKLDAARGLYAERANLSKNDQAIAILEEALDDANSSELRYDILVLASRAVYWKGMNTSSVEDKKRIFLKGKDLAENAKLESDRYAEAFYYAAINLSRWGEANGVANSLMRLPELVANVNKARAPERRTRDGKPGETIDFQGPDRVLGRVYFKVPGYPISKSLEHLEKAFRAAPTHVLNVSYLAESLAKTGSDADKARGRRILDELLAKDRATLNPDRVPETAMEWEEAVAVRRSLGN